MAGEIITRQGSMQLVDSELIAKRGALSVAEAQLRSTLQFLPAVVISSISSPLFYLLSIGVGIGSFVNSRSGTHGIDGVPYLTFLAPALLATIAIQDCMSEVVFPTLQGFKWNRLFFAMNSTPITGRQIALGTFLAALVRTFFSVLCYFIVMALFGVLHSPRSVLCIFTAMYGAGAFAALMMGLAAAVKNDDIFMTMITRFIVMPLFLFSGTFYPLSAMPRFLQWIGWISPLWHSTELGRYLTYGHHISKIALFLHLSYMTVMLVGGLLFSYNRFENRLAK
jgi:lipooligosaccharide transport system permease protein